MKTKVALITGITGQDGSYLAELLLEKGYEVHGIVRRVALEDSAKRFSRILHIKDQLHLHSGDIKDPIRAMEIVAEARPAEVYHLAAQSHVQVSFEDESGTYLTNEVGTMNLLNALKKSCPGAKLYFAATSELFGSSMPPQNEQTPFWPNSPYALSKLKGYHLVRMARENSKQPIFACSGILFNHESPRRGDDFVTRKITKGAVKIKLGLERELRLGNLESKRDWGFAGDYVEAMRLMLQQSTPKDYVIATGKTHTVREFVERVFTRLNLDYQKYVVIDPKYFRPLEVNFLLGDPARAKNDLGWQPRVSFEELVEMMVEADLKLLSK